LDAEFLFLAKEAFAGALIAPQVGSLAVVIETTV
jgi:hypothetical protein